jgi:hypothetical protein
MSGVYSREVWFRVFITFGWHALIPGGQSPTIEWWLRVRKEVSKSLRAKFDSVFALVAWCLWLTKWKDLQ